MRVENLGSKTRDAARILLRRHEAREGGRQNVWLQTGQTWSVAAQRGARFIGAQGTLWITQSGEAHDFLLHEGEEFIAQRDGLVVVQAVGEEQGCFRFDARPRGGGIRVPLWSLRFLTWWPKPQREREHRT